MGVCRWVGEGTKGRQPLPFSWRYCRKEPPGVQYCRDTTRFFDGLRNSPRSRPSPRAGNLPADADCVIIRFDPLQSFASDEAIF